MPWKESGVMGIRQEFVLEALTPGCNLSELCLRYKISRKTGYKWIARFRACGMPGLENRSQRPHTSPWTLSADEALSIVRLRLQYPDWGPKKIQGLLRQDGAESPASISTISRVLVRCQLVKYNKRGRPRRWHPGDPSIAVAAPNDLWTVDFKGWWRTRDGRRCEPLTVRDAYSKFILSIEPTSRLTSAAAKEEFERLFRYYGLPKAIRSDNGVPFSCTRSLCGFSRLSAWWKANGIQLQRGRPGHPQDNGAHERMHLDMQKQLSAKPAADIEAEVQRCEEWRQVFNNRRPHEALGQRTPAQLYRRSERVFTGQRPNLTYPDGFATRLVKQGGEIKWNDKLLFISESLAGWHIGIESLQNSRLRLWFTDICLGETDSEFRSPLRPSASAPTGTHNQ